MALVKCPECGTDVSDKAKKWPRCAYPHPGHEVDIPGRLSLDEEKAEATGSFEPKEQAIENKEPNPRIATPPQPITSKGKTESKGNLFIFSKFGGHHFHFIAKFALPKLFAI